MNQKKRRKERKTNKDFLSKQRIQTDFISQIFNDPNLKLKETHDYKLNIKRQNTLQLETSDENKSSYT